jgi:hypothetical protein
VVVVANGISFIAALALVQAVGPLRPAAAEGETEGERTRRGYGRVLRDRVNIAIAGLNVAATLLIIAPILVLPVFVLERLHLAAWLPASSPAS